MADSARAPLTSDVNAMLWGQFQLRGGWNRLAVFVVAYALALGSFLYLTAMVGEAMPAVAKMALVAAQGAILVLFAGARVGTSIRQDINSRLIDSHRLMPLAPAQALLGYIGGGAAQPLALAGVNLAFGVLASALVGTPVALWLTANAVLLGFATFAVVALAFGAFAGKAGGASLVWMGLFFTVMTSGAVGALMPALIVLVTPMIGASVFQLGVTGSDAAVVYGPPTFFQAWVGAVLFVAACRKYRRDDRPAFGIDLGLALLGAWVAASLYGIFTWTDTRPMSLGRGPAYHPVQYLGATASAMLVGLLPLAGSAFYAGDWDRRLALRDPATDDPTLGRRPTSPWLVALAATVMTLALSFAPIALGGANGWPVAPPDEWHYTPVVRTAVVVGSYFLGMASFLRVLHRRRDVQASYAVAPWLAVTWLLPLAIDSLRWYLTATSRAGPAADPLLGVVSSFSPIGALIETWTGRADVTAPGLAFQAFVAIALAAAYHGTRHRASAPVETRSGTNPNAD